MNRFFFLLGASLLVPMVSASAAPALKTATPAPMAPATDAWKTPLAGEQKTLNALNRLTFGPRPGDVARVNQIGLAKWIESQLNSDSIDDGEVEKQLASLQLLDAPSAKLMLAYAAENGQIRKFLQGRQLKAKGAAKGATNPDAPTVAAPMEVALNARDQKILDEFRASGMEPGAAGQALGEAMAAKLLRATDSPRQLQEVLTDFWSNHFNVDVNKQAVAVLKLTDEREAIRPHVFTSFRELLGASAHSAAMMVYLDNAKSTAGYTNKQTGQTRGGLNENYGREIMELHTLGVDGGYTQKDVTEVARCFTGWGTNAQGQWTFRPRAHDNGEKTVLGHVIPAGGGQKDGETVLDILAASPATASHIARELCVRFVYDEPPASLVAKVAAAFTQSNGDLKTVYRALFNSPEFNSRGAYRAKIKSPFEYAVSAVRALDGHYALPDPANPRQRLWLIAIGRSARNRGNAGANLARRPLATEIAAMGQPLWGYQAPTGYPEDSRQWVSSSALVARLNFALSLTQGRIGDVALGKDTFRNAPVGQVAQNLLSEPLGARSVSTIEDEVKVAPGDGAKVRALVLGSPEFQRK